MVNIATQEFLGGAMQPLVFSYDSSRYYGLALHAGPMGFDVHRGFLIELLQKRAQMMGLPLRKGSSAATRPFSLHPMVEEGQLRIELLLEDEEYEFAKAVGRKLNQGSDDDWQSLVINWLIRKEGIELWETIPDGILQDVGVRFLLNPRTASFYAECVMSPDGETMMALPAFPYSFN